MRPCFALSLRADQLLKNDCSTSSTSTRSCTPRSSSWMSTSSATSRLEIIMVRLVLFKLSRFSFTLPHFSFLCTSPLLGSPANTLFHGAMFRLTIGFSRVLEHILQQLGCEYYRSRISQRSTGLRCAGGGISQWLTRA